MNQNGEFSQKEILETLSSTPADRFPIPAAYADPAFNKCLVEAASIPEFIENFDRLTGSAVGKIGAGPAIVEMIDKVTGFRDAQLRKFAEFVHESVYLRLPSQAIHAIRMSSLAQEQFA